MEQRGVVDGEIWRGVFDASPDAVVITDADGVIVDANRQCRDVFRVDPTELVGRSVDLLVPKAKRRRHPERRASYSEVHAGRPMGLLPLAAARPDGSEFPAEISLASVSVGEQTFTVATVRDISERIQQEERFRELLESAPDGMVIVDDGGRILITNRQVRNLFGYEPDELVGQPVEVLVPDRFRPGHSALRDGFELSPVARPMGSGRQLFARRKDGTEFPVEISLSPLTTDDGVLVSAAVRDVSERKRLEEESNRVRDELVATVSHELRTPLTSIIGYVELMMDLDEDALGLTARRMLEVIERNASRELRLVNDLLDLSSLDGGISPGSLREIGIGGVVRTSVEGARLLAQGKQISLEAAVEDGLLVRADPQRMGQVLDNLLTNAIKFTPEGGATRVEAGRDGDQVWCEVTDTGVGIPAHEVPKVFERLFRSAGAVRDQVPGAGLGLTIARAIVESHGGTIEARSEVGVGTTVRVTLPASAGPVESQDEQPVGSSVSSSVGSS